MLLMLPTPIIADIPLLLLLLCSNNDIDKFIIKNKNNVPNTPTEVVFVAVNDSRVNITEVKITVKSQYENHIYIIFILCTNETSIELITICPSRRLLKYLLFHR